jgi:hypothetical protein
MTITKTRPLTEMYEPEEIAEARAYVDYVYENCENRFCATRRDPFSCGSYVPLFDPIKPRKEHAVRAVLARQWFANFGPQDADLQPLPIGMDEREALKRGGAPHILAWYARSVSSLEYDIILHPSFHDYACGIMARGTPSFITDDVQLIRRFPPRVLRGLDSSSYWKSSTATAPHVAKPTRRRRA